MLTSDSSFLFRYCNLRDRFARQGQTKDVLCWTVCYNLRYRLRTTTLGKTNSVTWCFPNSSIPALWSSARQHPQRWPDPVQTSAWRHRHVASRTRQRGSASGQLAWEWLAESGNDRLKVGMTCWKMDETGENEMWVWLRAKKSSLEAWGKARDRAVYFAHWALDSHCQLPCRTMRSIKGPLKKASSSIAFVFFHDF